MVDLSRFGVASPRLLAATAVVLVVLALLAFALNRHAIAGVLFLLVSFTIYAREKRL